MRKTILVFALLIATLGLTNQRAFAGHSHTPAYCPPMQTCPDPEPVPGCPECFPDGRLATTGKEKSAAGFYEEFLRFFGLG